MSRLSKTVRKLILPIVCSAGLVALFVALTPFHARADVDMSDYNTYWQVANDPAPPDPSLDYNTYWAEVQAKQQVQDRQ